ncbi:hypothetical protein [Aquaticitalea lipolytica]|uniref:hypothetical protein n=1 Tax=Aquaticitalea lipolytica TaxID=1247562 RepID=UPI0024BB8DF1|nr:hypothetical protein [Aquaticitalea lipolytica]
MKNSIALLILLLIVSSCKEEKKETIKELSIAEKIANAHGFEHWNKVKSFEFTFGGKADDPQSGRAWVWNPKTNDIKLVRDSVVTAYNRNNMDSIALKADRGFINDKFWALIPFQLIWDEGTTISEVEKSQSPIKKEKLNKITILYSNEGGYTPGDAYDIYFDDNYIIKEWSYREGNITEPSLSNTFENYQEFNGIKIALEHKKAEGDWNLLLRNIKVELEE